MLVEGITKFYVFQMEGSFDGTDMSPIGNNPGPFLRLFYYATKQINKTESQ